MVTFDYLPEFKRRAKVLAKKYRSFIDDYNAFLDELECNPFSDTPAWRQHMQTLYGHCLERQGKSGEARDITYNIAQKRKRYHNNLDVYL